jgi:tetratricopeptide (TPR) repeat protein
MIDFVKRYWLMFIGMLVYLLFSNGIFFLFGEMLWFIQDDAYITYRYVQNYLNGNGLVFNIGERIEGITNAGWAIVQIACGSWGLPYIPISQWLGLFFGLGIIYLTFKIAEEIFDKKEPWFAGAAALLVGLTQSLAYWSMAGLETACFAFFSLLSLYFLITRNWLLIWSTVMMVWMRPEGAVVTALLIIIDSIRLRKISWFPFLTGAVAFVLSLPFVGFKLSYYGGILPNPFYAKTRADLEHFQAGFSYVWEFLRHYGFAGLGLLIPALFWKKLTGWQQAILVYVLLYTLYIVSVGGDVLKVHRFFFPVFTGYAVLAFLSIQLFTLKMSRGTRSVVLFFCLIPMGFLTVYFPTQTVGNYNNLEKAFTRKMQAIAKNMKSSDGRAFSVSLATIGIFGYELIGHDIIDMVGLTDSTIARHPEPPIAGMTTTWRERNLNTTYLLKRAPDYVVFSTGIKPSAPAERALMLYRQFTDAYRVVAWYYESQPGAGVMNSAFKKTHPIPDLPMTPYYPVQYVQDYKNGLDHYARSRYDSAIFYYDKALSIAAAPPYIYVIYNKAFSLLLQNKFPEAMFLLDEVLARDSMVYEAHKDLDILYRIIGDRERSELHQRWLRKLVPWYLERHEMTAQEMLRSARTQMQQQQQQDQRQRQTQPVQPGGTRK